jgi:SAM-dependent methyltransferase
MLADEARALLSAEGLRLLDEVGPYDSGADVLRTSAALRRAGHPPALIAAVLTQARLREKARAKFGEFASRMLLTAAGLEQATRFRVAALHASRFRDAGVGRVVDLGCGIGGDAMALAALDIPVIAVERDEVTAAFAAYNLAPFPSAEVRVGDAESFDIDPRDAVFADPARREAGHDSRARLGPADWSPSLEFVFGLARTQPLGVKLGPAIDHELIPDEAEAQWITVDGETVEVGLWFGALARPGVRRSAVVLAAAGSVEIAGDADAEDPEPRELARYVHEPAGSVIRARMIGEVARRLDAGLVAPRIAYLTGDQPSADPLAVSFEVRAVLPFDERAIAKELRARGIGRIEIKKRGVDVDPAALRKRLAPKGDGDGTLIVTRSGDRRIAILADRVG